MKNIFFNAHHSPIGAFASFTLGFPGAKGGLGIELTKPTDSNVYIGLEHSSGKYFETLPFFNSVEDERKNFDLERVQEDSSKNIPLISFENAAIKREFEVCTDRWLAGDLDFKIYSQVQPVPNPETADDESLKKVLLPAVLVEMTIDNSKGNSKRRAFFGYDNSNPYYAMRFLDNEDKSIVGIGQGGMTGIVTKTGGATSTLGFSIESLLNETIEDNWKCGLGSSVAVIMDVLPGEKKVFRFAVCFYRDGHATTGIDTHYYYTKLFKNIQEVGEYALTHFDEYKEACEKKDKEIRESSLTEDQKFMLAHAIKSYYGSTEMLEVDGMPIWIVNEGEYRMLNTLDLTVDQLFYEMKMNPWTVRNVLELFLERYSYYDKVRFPGDTTEYPGGLTFTHDMGVGNIFSRKGYSSYERAGLTGCFSYMSHEQLVNWLCCALVYIEGSNDQKWLENHFTTLVDCFTSMLNRDNPDPEKRNGIMGLDSIRCQGGAEITTYDSLDVSLGQSRNNIYMGGKCWAAYVALEKLFNRQGRIDLAAQAGKQAELCAGTIVAGMTEEGFIPAVLGEGNHSRIIPAIEGLIFPYFTNCKEALDENGRFGSYIKALKKHFENVLEIGVCLFDNGAWKLSSTSSNSWLSKIYLSQFVARKILGFNTPDCKETADIAHVEWLTHPEYSYWSWSDQIISGVITGSKYYPRGVTSILWLYE